MSIVKWRKDHHQILKLQKLISDPNQWNSDITSEHHADPEEGTNLKFIPPHTINGVRCAKLEQEDVADGIEYWQQSILCSVIGANPSFEFVKRIWSALDIDKIIHVRRGVILVRFGNLLGKQMVERRGVYYFASKPFLVKGCNPKIDMHTKEIEFLPLWVQFLDLDVKYWGADSLNRFTKERSMIRYARLLIDVPLDSTFPEFIEFFNDNELLIRQQVVYEWKPVKCSHCYMFGHEEPVCKNKNMVRKEWRKVQRV
ncbi:hypothetical protein Cgig2_029229 [Carnegiea gigantea]|uniref:DUF4283 domain-containing protein n=1 Tax=Carnegiea gigantea TaxID=171969 RepID=A0A9Q1JHU4_9CARY|nr:hypothetical protein Cgig2_029229 [Carnegiea gigantea]